jgi:hypothetical protein
MRLCVDFLCMLRGFISDTIVGEQRETGFSVNVLTMVGVSPNSAGDEEVFVSRMFAPLAGVPEGLPPPSLLSFLTNSSPNATRRPCMRLRSLPPHALLGTKASPLHRHHTRNAYESAPGFTTWGNTVCILGSDGGECKD